VTITRVLTRLFGSFLPAPRLRQGPAEALRAEADAPLAYARAGCSRVFQHPASLRVIGIGNEMRHDDAVGLSVARALASLGLPGVEVFTSVGDPLDLIERWRDSDRVLVIDASSCGQATPGTIRRFNVHEETLPVAAFLSSSHALGLAQSIELSRAMGSLPPELVVIAIEAGDVSYGTGLTPAVTAAVDRLVAELEHASKPRAGPRKGSPAAGGASETRIPRSGAGCRR
jgi:hydrogenase maturation protease